MARGINFTTTYSLRTPSAGGGFCQGNGPTNISLAQFVLQSFGIPINGGAFPGNPLTGYDVKSQDALQVMKLSLLANSDGKFFTEAYVDGSGSVIAIEVGESSPGVGGGGVLLHTTAIHTSAAKIDHVVAQAKAPLPYRAHGGTVDVMGAGIEKQFRFDCPLPSPGTKNLTFRKEAWVEFQRSEQSQVTQDALKAAVSRNNWENLVGYRASFASIPIWSTMNPSQTSPDILGLPVTGFSDTTIPIANATPDSGGLIDVSGISMASAPVLDIKSGAELEQIASSLGVDLASDTGSFYTPELDAENYYILLSHECGLNSLSRGTNWFLLPTNSPFSARVAVRESTSSLIARSALGGFAFDGLNQTITYRADNGFIGSFQDVMTANKKEGNPLLGSSTNIAFGNANHGVLIAGFGGNLGVEVWGLSLTVSKQTSSIQIRSQNNDAFSIANSVAAQGVNYTALIVREEPACAGLAPGGGIVCPTAPPDNETASYCPENLLDTLEGSIIEISTPWLDAQGASEFATNLYTLISNDVTSAGTYTYSKGGYSMFPGYAFQGAIIHSVEFNYSDRGSQVTTITTGPKYYQSGSAGGDSTYIKRSETINKPGVVIGGDNESGTFSVNVDGLGIYEAINGQIDPIYPGDRVEVKILNFPVEN